MEKQDSHSQLLKGSLWMTFGSIMSRILGALYIIPWYAWMGHYGNIANALTAKSYNIYTLFLLISTAGIPGAIAKQIAKYNALNEYGVGQKLFKRGLLLMGAFGVISALMMFFFAPIFGANDPRQIPVIRSLSVAVLIIPIESILRGYFQGFSNMMPSAVSQFVEQLARVIWMLATAYFIMQVQHGSYLHAVTQSNLAAAVGAVFGIALLAYLYFRQKKQTDVLIENSNHELTVSTTDLFKEIIGQAVPFIVIDAGINFYQLLDQYTFHPFINRFVDASYDQIESWYALFGLNANKLIMIIVSLATAMAMTAIPLLSAAHVRQDFHDIKKQLANTIELFMFVMVPASMGMAAVSSPVYTIFYGYDGLGAKVLYLSAFTAIGLGLFTVLMALLQGLSENKLAIRYLFFGFAVKIIAQYPMISLFKVYGPLIATNLGMIATILLATIHLRIQWHFDLERTLRRCLGIITFSLIMFAVVSLVVYAAGFVLNPQARFSSVLLTVIGVIAGVIVYGWLTFATGLAEAIMGSRITRILSKLHIK